MPAAGPAIRNAEHTLDAADRTTDAGANRATDHTTDRTGSTIAFVRTLIAAALHTSDDALRRVPNAEWTKRASAAAAAANCSRMEVLIGNASVLIFICILLVARPRWAMSSD